MAIKPETNQYLTQRNFLRHIDNNGGPDGPQGVTSYWLIPTNGYHNGHRFPHEVKEDLDAQGHDKVVHEGIEYFRVPEVSTNTPGRLAHYAQLTGEADLRNPPGGGVNRARETFVENSTSATVDPESVRKYVDEIDSFEEARKKKSAEDEQVAAQVHASVPAREPADGKLTSVGDGSEDKKGTPNKEAPKSTSPAPTKSDE